MLRSVRPDLRWWTFWNVNEGPVTVSTYTGLNSPTLVDLDGSLANYGGGWKVAMQTTLSVGGLDEADWPRMWDRIVDLVVRTGGVISSTCSNHDTEIGRFWQVVVDHSEAQESALQTAWNEAFLPRQYATTTANQ